MPRYRNSERLVTAECKRSNKRDKAPLLLGIAVSAVLALSGTAAFLLASTSEVKNAFDAAQVSCRVDETIDGATKENVKVTNTSDIKAYIRATLVVNWADEAGNVYGESPVSNLDNAEIHDYKITFASNEGDGSEGKWVKGADGFWYWTTPVAPGQPTGDLIESCTQVGNAPEDDYFLSVEILASAIQALPTDVVADEWDSGVSGVNETSGALIIKNLQMV